MTYSNIITFTIVTLVSILSIQIIWPYWRQFQYWWRLPRDGKTKAIPMVEGNLPLVGHGLEFGKDILGFISRNYKKYGSIFRIQIFRTEMIVVADQKLAKQFFGFREKRLSLYDVLKRL